MSNSPERPTNLDRDGRRPVASVPTPRSGRPNTAPDRALPRLSHGLPGRHAKLRAQPGGQPFVGLHGEPVLPGPGEDPNEVGVRLLVQRVELDQSFQDGTQAVSTLGLHLLAAGRFPPRPRNTALTWRKASRRRV